VIEHGCWARRDAYRWSRATGAARAWRIAHGVPRPARAALGSAGAPGGPSLAYHADIALRGDGALVALDQRQRLEPATATGPSGVDERMRLALAGRTRPRRRRRRPRARDPAVQLGRSSKPHAEAARARCRSTV